MSDEVRRTRSDLLARLIRLGAQPAEPWTEDDLRSILRHQLDAPLVLDLGDSQEVQQASKSSTHGPRQRPLRSFDDLFNDPDPPIQLLRLAKDFAKANIDRREGGFPRDVARVLYYAAISVAHVRCGTRITKLTDQQLAAGLDWSLERAWLDEPVRALFLSMRNSLSPGDDAKPPADPGNR